MSAYYKILDSFKLTGHLNTNFACSISQDDRILIISDIGLYIISVKSNLSNPFPKFSCQNYFIKTSCFTICDKVDIDLNQFVHELPKDILYETVARVELSQTLINATSVEPSIVSAQWSEASMVNDTDCMLGILTNLYSLEIYVKNFNQNSKMQYNEVLNLTSEIIEQQRNHFVYSARLPPVQRMNELKKRVENIAPTAFCWGHIFTLMNQTCTVIFLGNFHGVISVWRIFSIESNRSRAKYEFLGRYNTKLGRINALSWHRTHEFGGGLCIGDFDGKIAILHIRDLEQPQCSINTEVEFYSEKDRKVDKITTMMFEEYTIIAAVKQCYILLFGLNKCGRVFDFIVHNVDNFYITGITHHKNKFKILTFTGAFKELTLSVHLNKISVEETPIQVKLDFTGFRSHGYIESTNKILLAFLLSPCRLKNSVRGKQFVYFFLLHDAKLDPLKLLLENKSGSLRTYWDCLETLRLLCLKEQRFPWLGINSHMDHDKLSLLELKTLRLIAKLSETVFTVVKKVVSYDIKPFILLHYLVEIKLRVQMLNRLFREKNLGRNLSEFEMRSIDLQVFFLKEMVVSGILPKAQVGKTFIEEITRVLEIANEMTFPDMINCDFCGEKLIGPMCLPPHADSRCSFTMMPIFLVPAYKCVLCNSLAHNRVKEERTAVYCQYCDYPMEKVCLNEAIEKTLVNFEKVADTNQVMSKCFGDCLKDSSETVGDLLVNLAENEMNIVIFSDSDEDEEVSGENKLTEVFFKIANMNINDDVILPIENITK